MAPQLASIPKGTEYNKLYSGQESIVDVLFLYSEAASKGRLGGCGCPISDQARDFGKMNIEIYIII